MKKIMTMIGLALLASALWSAPSLEQEPGQDGAQRLIALVNLAAESLGARKTKEGVEALKSAKKLLPNVPDTEEGKLAKASYYRLSSEASALGKAIGYAGGIPSNEATLCAKYNTILGAQAFYALANFYASQGDAYRSVSCFDSAFKYDNNFALTTGADVKNYYAASMKGKLVQPTQLVSFVNKLFSSNGFSYFKDFGAFSASVYEKDGSKDLAAAAAILDREYTLTYKDSSADAFLDILKKNYTTANAQKATAFIEKFYDESQTLSKEDLDSLPEKARDFLPVRYMYKMKTSNDVAALRKEFEPFFKTVGNFYIRLHEKAEKNGDKKTMAELKEILTQPIHNIYGRNRLTK